jgi:hypothetical protein
VANAEPSIDDFMAAMDHPLKPEIAAVRKVILGADQAIQDGVKWNSLSFRTTEWFATIHLRTTDQVQLVMHLGVKSGKTASKDAFSEHAGLLKWLGKDRAMLSLGAGKSLKASLPALEAIVRAWIAFV